MIQVSLRQIRVWLCYLVAITFPPCFMALTTMNAQDLATGKAAQVHIGSSTWRDVEKIFGKSYLIDEPSTTGGRADAWEMVYPLHSDYGVDVSFTIDRNSGVVEMRNFGRPEPEIVRTLVTQFHCEYCSPKSGWVMGQWNGIALGKSTPEDVKRELGRGNSKPCDGVGHRTKLMIYARPKSFDGVVTVVFSCDQRQAAQHIFLEPTSPLSLQGAFETFGSGYCYRRFIVTDVPEEEESGHLVENPRGNWVQVEYPSKGLVLSPNHEDKIRAISFQKPPTH